ncbi:MAG: hypothetical protein ACREBK_06370, partial [Sphingomicrobium sp.]
MKRLAILIIGTTIAAVPAAVAVQAGAAQPATLARASSPMWFANGSPAAARQLIQLLATAQVEGLNPKRYNVKGLSRVVEAATSGNPAARHRAERMLN